MSNSLLSDKGHPRRKPSAAVLRANVTRVTHILRHHRQPFYPLEEANKPLRQRDTHAPASEETIRSYFIGVHGAYDLDWALDLLMFSVKRGKGGSVQLPDELIGELFSGYCARRVPAILKDITCRDANLWLSDRVKVFRQVQADLPEPLDQLQHKDHRERLAMNYVERVQRLLDAATNNQANTVPATYLWRVCAQPLKPWGFLPALPAFKSTETRDTFIAAHLIRWLDPQWWVRKLRKLWEQYREHCAILLGKVRRGVSPYVSSYALRAFNERQLAAEQWLKSMEAYNEEHDIAISLADAVASSMANPSNRRDELVVRARGFSDAADEMGYIGLFFTWTAPSQYHPWKTTPQGHGQPARTTENPKYLGHTPRDTNTYLGTLWKRCRAALARRGIEYFGFRVVEPHHDGTPHWHLLLFVNPAQQHELISTLQRYALSHDQGDLERKRHPVSKRPYSDITPRFDWKVMDPAKGGAVGYIVKYIAKNIDGHQIGDEGDLEAETAASEGARRVRAWASLWGLRQFQQLGGPSVSVWRELRRLPGRVQESEGRTVAPLESEIMEECRRYADAANWKEFTYSMGGPVCPRDARPVRLHHLIDPAKNKYGEDVIRLVGVAAGNTIKATRLDGWVLRRKTSEKPTESAEEVLSERSDAGFGERSEVPSSGDSCAPWSSGNNCTQHDDEILFKQNQMQYAPAVQRHIITNVMYPAHNVLLNHKCDLSLVNSQSFHDSLTYYAHYQLELWNGTI
ncbi:replication endonuclease [Aeromonas eucrenophila]|uniref:Replication endonuclease n=1 Tax=Aeromonas eucrenophila TaxID=649 RepID=A0ABW0Y9C0_9GAMM|nr:replication endonuclease [Aeromonas eucrenophila]